MTDRLDPNMVNFLSNHTLARSIVYKMMRNAATTKDDPLMVEWYSSVESAADKKAVWNALTSWSPTG